MKNKSLFAGLLLLFSTAVQADPSSWTFEYRGFYPWNGPGFDPNVTLTGSFTGEDLNHNNIIERSELSALTAIGMEFVGCNGDRTIYHYCEVKNFSFSPNGALDFFAYFDDYRQEGHAETTIEISTGSHFLNQERNSHDYSGYYYFFAPQTRLSIQPMTPVPEPGRYAMLAFGLLGIAGWRRR
jgi:hypothetical protein